MCIEHSLNDDGRVEQQENIERRRERKNGFHPQRQDYIIIFTYLWAYIYLWLYEYKYMRLYAMVGYFFSELGASKRTFTRYPYNIYVDTLLFL